MRSNIAILEANNAVPLTKASSFGASDSWSRYCAVEIAKARMRGKEQAERELRCSYQEAINALTHDLFAKKITHEQFKRRERKLKKRFEGVKK